MQGGGTTDPGVVFFRRVWWPRSPGAERGSVHASSQDNNCNCSNNNVIFDVRPVNVNGQCRATASLPGASRASRNILIDVRREAARCLSRGLPSSRAPSASRLQPSISHAVWVADPPFSHICIVSDQRVNNPAVMPRPADPHARNALVAAARAEFARRGLRGARIEDITAACGLSKGAFYLHFPSKEALFGEVVGAFQAGMDALNARRMALMERFFAERGIPGPKDRQERSERYQQLIEQEAAHDLEAMEWVWAHRDVSLVLVSGSQGTEFESLLWRVTDAQVERVARDFRRLQEAGAVDQELDPHLFGSVIVGAYLLLSKQMARLSKKPDLATWARMLQRLFQEGTIPRLDAPPGPASTPARATSARAPRSAAPSTRRPGARAKTRRTPRNRS